MGDLKKKNPEDEKQCCTFPELSARGQLFPKETCPSHHTFLQQKCWKPHQKEKAWSPWDCPFLKHCGGTVWQLGDTEGEHLPESWELRTLLQSHTPSEEKFFQGQEQVTAVTADVFSGFLTQAIFPSTIVPEQLDVPKVKPSPKKVTQIRLATASLSTNLVTAQRLANPSAIALHRRMLDVGGKISIKFRSFSR